MIKEKLMKFIPLFIFILALIITRWVKNVTDNNSSFKYYNYYNIASNQEEIKEKLVYDSYFIRFTNLNNYSNEIDMNNIQELLQYYKENITKNKSKEFIDYRNEYGFCINKRDFIDSFKELFNKDISSLYSDLESVDFVYLKKNTICFNDKEKVDDDFEFVIVKSVSIQDRNNIVLNLYRYNVDIDEQDDENILKDKINNVIKNNKIEEFNNDFIDIYSGEIEEKEIKFKELNRGKYFKYQLVSISSR